MWKYLLLSLIVSVSMVNGQFFKKEFVKIERCPAPVPLTNIIYPWPHHEWPEIHVYWNYEMKMSIMQFMEGKIYVYGIQVKTDSINQRSRQDVYVGREGNIDLNTIFNRKPIQTVISDYKYATIMDLMKNNETKKWDCEISRFDESLDIISNILSEIWIPKRDSYTMYLGEQNIEQTNGTFYGFQTLSSDEEIWNVFFNKETKQPQFAMSGKDDNLHVIINKGDFISRTYFDKDEFMPKECFDQRNSRKIEGPIIPLADYGLVF